MATAARITKGTLFKKGATTLAEVTGISDVGPEADEHDSTSLDSANNCTEYIPGMVDSGLVSIDMNFLASNATQQALTVDMLAMTTATYSVTWTSGRIWTFSAFVKSVKAGGEVRGKLSCTAVFRITGVITES